MTSKNEELGEGERQGAAGSDGSGTSLHSTAFPPGFASWGYLTEHHRWGAFNDRNVFSQSSGGWKSQTKVSVGLDPSEGWEG